MGLNTEDWVGIMGSIGKILEHKRLERRQEANQPLVQIWDDTTNSKIYVPRKDALGQSSTQNEADKWQDDATSSLDMFTEIYTNVDLSEAKNLIGKIETENDYKIFQDYLKTKDPAKGLNTEQIKQRDVDLKEFSRVNRILQTGISISIVGGDMVVDDLSDMTEDVRAQFKLKRIKLQDRLYANYGISIDFIDKDDATIRNPSKKAKPYKTPK